MSHAFRHGRRVTGGAKKRLLDQIAGILGTSGQTPSQAVEPLVMCVE